MALIFVALVGVISVKVVLADIQIERDQAEWRALLDKCLTMGATRESVLNTITGNRNAIIENGGIDSSRKSFIIKVQDRRVYEKIFSSESIEITIDFNREGVILRYRIDTRQISS